MTEAADQATLSTDIAIIGAGPVGMTLALALAGSPLRILLIDRRARRAWLDDPRALALAHGSRQLLERLHAWNAAASTAITEIHVSQRGGFGRTLMRAEDYATPALGYVMPYRALAAALDAQIPDDRFIDECIVEASETDAEQTRLTVTRHGTRQQIDAKLVVHAEGTPETGPGIRVHDYEQHAVVAEVRPAVGHQHRAWERFTPDGPLALLPNGVGYSVVFTLPPEKATQMLQLDDAAFLTALQNAFGRRVEFVASGPRAGFPLALRVRSPIIGARQVWIGNSAQTLHPVSGQGVNLGLRDAWELAETLLAGQHADAGHPATLAAYARGRRSDRRSSTAFTDGVVRLFSNDLPPLRLARGLGLLALDLYPPLRHLVAKRMIWGARAWP
ncbi:MAG: FAD-dependent monooxygenase [Propionivibrio sp.]